MMNGVWTVMDNIEPLEIKIFKSKEKALEFFEKSKNETLMGDIIEEYCEGLDTDDEFRFVTFSETLKFEDMEENACIYFSFVPFSDEEIE